MIELRSIADLELLRESVELECKLAGGRDGQGAIPESFWPTYSAMANTQGGAVLFGLQDVKGRFDLVGIQQVAKVRQELFDCLNNRNKVNVNLMSDASVQEVVLEEKSILAIEIPRAARHDRPVFLNGNPLGRNAYRRLNEGDFALSDEEVKRMLAEQVEDSRDTRVLDGFGLDDLAEETVRTYRQVFSNRDPGHVWNSLADEEFLRQTGCWVKDRQTGKFSLTLAGVLMFGQMRAIQEALPNYMLDYQERAEPRTESRWVDRLTLDGKWSGNLYDFYRKVYVKLTADLKVPFKLEKGERKEETPVHEALREALANVLVHADYSDRASVLVVKRPDMFGFRNPGLMRIPVEVAIRGGEADCRNRTIHKLFRMVGVGEQAGTGIPKILKGWRSQQWSLPALYERTEPYNQTVLELRMTDLFPAAVRDQLRVRFGEAYEGLSELERIAVTLAASEGTVNHARLRALSDEHPVDISRTLQHLTKAGMLESTGGRGAVYHLPGDTIPTPDDIFGANWASSVTTFPNLPGSLPNLRRNLRKNLRRGLPALGKIAQLAAVQRDTDGRLLNEQLRLPLIDDLAMLSDELRARLEDLATEPRMHRKVSRDTMIEAILALCSDHFVTVNCLAELVQRKPDTLRDQYLTGLVRERQLTMAFPKTPTHELQAYCATAAREA